MICPPILQRTGERLAPMGLEVTLATDALPTAKISLAEDPGVRVHDLLEIFTAQGSAGLFRVTDRAKTYGDEITLDARGALDTLSDDIYPGEDTLTGTPAAVLADILSKQSTARWQLGNVAMTGTVKIRNSYTNLFDLAEAVRTDKTGYWWMFDFSTIPWTVSLAALPTDTAAEFRLGRNVASAKIDLSDSELFTRLYMTVSTDSASTLYTYNNTAAQATWGVISRTIDVDADEVTDPAATGAAILAEHAQPVAFITLDGYDLKRLTGDNFDRITLGSLCRVVLPDFEATFSERVTRITWPDALTEPERITVSLANNLTPFDDQLKLIKKTGGGTARQVAEQERELVRHETSIDQNNDRILLWATASEWDAIAQQYQTYQRSEFSLMSDRISLVVSGTGSSATIKAASIVAAVNNAGSTVLIDADHIKLTGSTTLDGSVNVLGMMSIDNGDLYINGSVRASDTLKGQKLSLAGQQTYTINGDTFGGMIKTALVSGNTLTLNRIDGTSLTFNKAVSLSGAWSGGTYTVTATSGTISGTAPSTTLGNVSGANSITSNGTYTYKVMYIDPATQDEMETGRAKTVTVALPASTINLGTGHYSPSISTSGKTQISSWVSIIKQAVNNNGYFYFDAYLTGNTSSTKTYYMKFS